MSLDIVKYTFLFFLTAAVPFFAWCDDSVAPAKACLAYGDRQAALLCTAKLWCPDCGLDSLDLDEIKIQPLSPKLIDVRINTKKHLNFGSLKGTGEIQIQYLMHGSDDIRLYPVKGYIDVGHFRTTQAVPLPMGKSAPLKMSDGLTKLLKTFQYENVSFRKSIYTPYSLRFATLTIKAGQTVCGVHFPSKTQVIFNAMEIDDDSFEVRPTTPVVANGKTYPKYSGRLEAQRYELFDGKKCSVSFQIDDEPDDENLDPFK